MDKRRGQNPDYTYENKAGKQGVKRTEEFRGRCWQRIDRTHPAQNHRSIQKRIDPTQMRQVVVTKNANSKTKGQNSKGN